MLLHIHFDNALTPRFTCITHLKFFYNHDTNIRVPRAVRKQMTCGLVAQSNYLEAVPIHNHYQSHAISSLPTLFTL